MTWVTSARAFLGEGAFFSTSGGEEQGVLVTQCLMDILEEGTSLGDAEGLAAGGLAGVEAVAVGVLGAVVGVQEGSGRSPHWVGAQAAGRGEEMHTLPALRALAGVLCGLTAGPGRGEIRSLMRNTEQQIKDSLFKKHPFQPGDESMLTLWVRHTLLN